MGSCRKHYRLKYLHSCFILFVVWPVTFSWSLNVNKIFFCLSSFAWLELGWFSVRTCCCLRHETPHLTWTAGLAAQFMQDKRRYRYLALHTENSYTFTEPLRPLGATEKTTCCFKVTVCVTQLAWLVALTKNNEVAVAAATCWMRQPHITTKRHK